MLTSVSDQKKFSPAFDFYADGWPVPDMMMQYMANSKQGAKKQCRILDADKENAVSVLYLNDIYDSYRHLYHRTCRLKRMIMITKVVISVQWKARR